MQGQALPSMLKEIPLFKHLAVNKHEFFSGTGAGFRGGLEALGLPVNLH